jgi:hypothetical protein
MIFVFNNSCVDNNIIYCDSFYKIIGEGARNIFYDIL